MTTRLALATRKESFTQLADDHEIRMPRHRQPKVLCGTREAGINEGRLRPLLSRAPFTKAMILMQTRIRLKTPFETSASRLASGLPAMALGAGSADDRPFT